MGRRRAGRVLITVLFTDIVGSTDLARELGDRGWQALLRRHHAIVRRELKRFGGRERDTAGDGFFATFERPASAVRCAAAVAQAVRVIGIEIRAGVHTGEVELASGDVRGIAVHLGARVMSQAGPGDVLVSATTRDLVTGSGIGFEDRGHHALKGMEGETQLFAVRDIDGEPLGPPPASDEATRRRQEHQPAPRSRRSAVVAATVAIAALVAFTITYVGGRDHAPAEIATSDPPGPLRANTVIAFDPEEGTIVHAIPDAVTPLGNIGSRLAVGEGAVWVLSTNLVALDAETGAIRETFPSVGVTGFNAFQIAVGARAVWVPSGAQIGGGGSGMIRFNPGSYDELPAVDFAPGNIAKDVAVGEASAWVCFANGEVLELHQFTGRPVGEPFPVADSLDRIVVGGDAVWVLEQFTGTVTRIDPRTHESVATISVSPNARELVVGERGIWVLDPVAATVTRIDPITNQPGGPIGLGTRDPAGIAAGLDAIWVVDRSGTIVRVDPLGTTGSIDVGAPIDAIATDDEHDLLWLTTASGPSRQ